MDPEISLNVFVGAPELLQRFPDGPCLIIDADQQRLDHLHRQLPPQPRECPVELIQGVVATENSGGLTWHRFSDPRFNGPWPLSEWSELAPNLSEIDQCSLQPRPLISFLDQSGWLGDQNLIIKLWLRQGDPIDILKSAGSVLQRVDSIQLRYPALPAAQQVDLENALSQVGLVLSDLDDNAWIRQRLNLSELNQPGCVNALRLLFDGAAYRQLRPDLNERSDRDLLQHWLDQPDSATLAESLRRTRQTMPRQIDQIADDDVVIQALSSLFPYSFYRSQRPDLAHLSDQDLLRHYCRVGRDEEVDLADGVLMPRFQEALTKVFPYTLYRQQCPDLADLDDRSLIEHYCRSGMHQTIDLSEQSVVHEAQAFPASEQEQLHIRVKELEELLAAAVAQISALQQTLSELMP